MSLWGATVKSVMLRVVSLSLLTYHFNPCACMCAWALCTMGCHCPATCCRARCVPPPTHHPWSNLDATVVCRMLATCVHNAARVANVKYREQVVTWVTVTRWTCNNQPPGEACPLIALVCASACILVCQCTQLVRGWVWWCLARVILHCIIRNFNNILIK